MADDLTLASPSGLRAADPDRSAEIHASATTALQSGQSRTIKHGDTFAVFNQFGDALAGAGSPEGLYHRDTRYLSHFRLMIEDAALNLLSSTVSDDNSTLACDLTNPDLYDRSGAIALEQGVLHIGRTRVLWQASLFERVTVTNFGETPCRFHLDLIFRADFADLFEVRGTKRERRGCDNRPEVAADAVTLSYTGLDDRRRDTVIRFSPTPATLTAGQASFAFELKSKETRSIFIQVGCGARPDRPALPEAFFVALRDGRRALRGMAKRAVAIDTSNALFNATLNRSVSDLRTLTTELATGPYPYAGIPWFSAVFGRDALLTAWSTLWLDPSLARGVLTHLAANQATQRDDKADAEPGKILHEARGGEMAALGEVPFGRYYGSVDATPLFLCLAGAYLKRTGDLEFIRLLRPNFDAALEWIERYGDRDADGFVEYARQTAQGLANQGWKDSHDSISHSDGSLARGPIALAEVQAYVYGARRAVAEIALALGDAPRALEQSARAEALRSNFDRHFFDEALGTYALALDGDKKPCRVRSSNAGHALFTGIAFPEKAAIVAQTLMSHASFSGWGVRTLASNEARYNPTSYHNGSVWPHDNAIIAAGFARYGMRSEACRIFEGLFAAATYIDLQRLPELFCGFRRRTGRGPTFYPVACSPQAWAAAAPLSLLCSCLGLEFDAGGGKIVLDAPILPEFVTDVSLRHLKLAKGSADILVSAVGGRVVVDVLSESGGVQVVSSG